MDNELEQNLLHEVLSSIREVVKDTRDDIKEIKEDIGDIKLDLNHHILRTNLLEDSQKEEKKKVEALEKEAWKLKGALALLGFVLMLLATWGAFFKK